MEVGVNETARLPWGCGGGELSFGAASFPLRVTARVWRLVLPLALSLACFSSDLLAQGQPSAKLGPSGVFAGIEEWGVFRGIVVSEAEGKTNVVKHLCVRYCLPY